ncbi:hypothetical protein MMC25_005392 [Agyrium rufum]|nr:hypothetical protein [Agyrium rufum]
MPPQLPTRPLGRNGPQVTAMGFGLMGLSFAYGDAGTDEERLQFLDEVYDRGELFWDSADIYGDSEELVGRWFKRSGKRDEIFLATKFANVFNPDGTRSIRDDAAYVKEACNTSLQRLGTDHIDLYYCHRFSGKVPVEETVGAMAELVKEGKVKYLGLSECSADTLRRGHAIHPIAAAQMEYSPFAMEIESAETEFLKTCRELGVAVISYSPLGRGFLTGRYRSLDDFDEKDFRRIQPRFSKENFPKNLALLEKLDTLANKKGCTPGQLTLAWLMAQGEDIIPIPGTKKVKYLEENLASINLKLTEAEVKEIREAVDGAEVHGSRYAEAMMSACFRDTPPLKG